MSIREGESSSRILSAVSMKRLLLFGGLLAVIVSGPVVARRLMERESAPKNLKL